MSYIDRQQAIDALGERPMVWTDNDNYSLGQRNQYDSDRLAIETVPSAQPEVKGAIESLQKLLDKAKAEMPKDHMLVEVSVPVYIAEALAYSQPERKKGRWVKDRLTALNGGSYEVFRCSECQSAFNWRMAYCGHCGAKMEVEHEV